MKQKQFTLKLYAALFAAGLLFTSLSLSAQVKIGTNPTTIEPTSNLEVEASTNGNKMKVNKTTGQITIKDGTQADGRVLTSDASGNASWQAATQLIFMASVSSYTVPTGLVNGTVGQRIPFTPNFGSGYNASTKQYIIPSSGYYRISGGVRCVGTTGLAQNVEFILNDGKHGPSDIAPIDQGSSKHRSFSVMSYYEVSTPVTYYINNQTAGSVGCSTGYLAVERIIP